jgi:Zn-dependent protease with chaperone function
VGIFELSKTIVQKVTAARSNKTIETKIPNDNTSLPPPEIATALEEYRTVRQEELAAMQGHVSTLRYGVTGCVVLVGFAAQQGKDRYLGWIIALTLVPLVVLFSAVIWMGEYERMARVGHYMAIVEERINKRLEHIGWPPFEWESWLRSGALAQSRIIGGLHRYFAIIAVFVGFLVVSAGMGLHFYWHRHSHDASREWLIPLLVAANFGILVTLLGYFRSSYERLRDFAQEPDARPPAVRERVRVRLRLYTLFLVVGLLSVPFVVWPLSLLLVGLFDRVPTYVAVVPGLLWMAILPLLAPEAVMRELLERRMTPASAPDGAEAGILESSGAFSQLKDWERKRLGIVASGAINAPAVGRRGITLTTDAIGDPDALAGTFAHEMAHHRLHHLHPLALSYLYIWPYLYYDDKFRSLHRHRLTLLAPGERLPMRVRIVHCVRYAAWTCAAISGWMAWSVLRLGWRAAEYDADRFACVSGGGAELARALDRHERLRRANRPHGWHLWWRYIREGFRNRLQQGRSLGYLPIPNEHPSLRRRRERLWRWEIHQRRATAPASSSTSAK